ncbi:MAG: branched-chain amino acid transport system substrate-binding protein [Pseudonocardiales bacterium]|nr:branched-chain amino acid transport system substrate-binding protein [Pseudonocardiales bacterium]
MRSRAMTTIVVFATAGALALAGCSSSKTGGGPKTGGLGGGGNTGGNTVTKTYKIGFVGALSGDYAQLGINERQGAALAIQQANDSGKYDFKIALSAQDSQGDPTQAKPAAAALISDQSVVATIGPAFSGESEAVNPDFCGATPPMPTVTPSASKGTLQTHGWKCWHRIIPNDNVEGSQGADWLARTGAKKVFVLDDASPYGQGVSQTMAKELKAKKVTVQTGSVPATTTKNYDPIASTIVNSGADAVFYGGYDAQTALLAKSLKGAGFTGRTVTGNGSKDSTFTKNAGGAGNGWYFTCGCQDATKAPTAKAFATAYKQKFGEEPSTYSPEAYDAANLLMDAISKAEASGTVTRTSVLTALNAEDFTGITTQIKFQADGEVVPSNLIVNLFQQKNGAITGLGNIKTLK